LDRALRAPGGRGPSGAGLAPRPVSDPVHNAAGNVAPTFEEAAFMTRVARVLVALAVILALPAAALAQKYEGTAVKSGQAAVRFADKDLAFAYVEGGFQQMQGFTMATLVFRPEAKSKGDPHLNITVMYQAPGRVDLDSAFSTSGIGMFHDGDVARFTKGKSKCTITLTKATPTEVEGTAECPLLHNIQGTVMPALTVRKFAAAVK
jgi:hypothetical protein